MKERISKLISQSGLASRRAGEELIRAGRVTLNGVTASIGDCADIATDLVCVDGKPLPVQRDKKTYIMLHKPRGYVTTMSDEKGRRCVSDLVSELGIRLFPVGRLDMFSEGLLIMTDDGELANRLMHPSGEAEKKYYAWIEGKTSAAALKTLGSRLVIDGYRIQPAKIRTLREGDDYTLLEICISEGRNRQIRKMCELAGVKLTRLRRVSEAGLELGELPRGKWRYLTEQEVQDLIENSATNADKKP